MSIDVLYTDGEGTSIRCSAVKQYDRRVSFAPIAIKTVIQGTEHYYFENNLLKASEQKVVVGNSNTEARILIDSKVDVKGICIDFGTSMISDFLLDSSFSSDVVLAILNEQYLTGELKSQNKTLQGLVLNLFRTIKSEFSQTKVEEQLLLILQSYFDIQEFRLNHARKLRYVRSNTKVNTIDFILDAKCYIDNNYQNNVNLDLLSNQVGLSKFKLLRDFKAVFGTTPYDYMISKRLEKAVTYLGIMPIHEIAILVGFADSSSFGKLFKQYFGMTPRQYVVRK